MSTSTVDTWRTIKIWTKNLIEVPNEFLPLIQVSPMTQNKTNILNLKTLKTHIPMEYLNQNIKLKNTNIYIYIYIKREKKKKEIVGVASFPFSF
jgi:hypothetical protein